MTSGRRTVGDSWSKPAMMTAVRVTPIQSSESSVRVTRPSHPSESVVQVSPGHLTSLRVQGIWAEAGHDGHHSSLPRRLWSESVRVRRVIPSDRESLQTNSRPPQAKPADVSKAFGPQPAAPSRTGRPLRVARAGRSCPGWSAHRPPRRPSHRGSATAR